MLGGLRSGNESPLLQLELQRFESVVGTRLHGDGRNDSCFQSSYQENPALAAGNFEYHARVNNTGMAGSQQVEWGMDRDADGRIDGRDDDDIKVDWSVDGKPGGSFYSW